jgi:hypothetical protein
MGFNEVIAYVGARGSGKTLYATATAVTYSKQDYQIFTNYHLFNVKNHRLINFKDLSAFPEWLRDGIIIMDEMHIGADSYNFLHKDVRDITKFITQLRKRNLMFIYITQDFSSIAKRLRTQTNYYYEFKVGEIGGTSIINVFDLQNNFNFIQQIAFNGKYYFKFYDTNEIIS